ncbi:MAG: WD40 repeat domain-containing protein [Campylobacterales bacterium]
MLNKPFKTLHLGAVPLAMIESGNQLIVAGNDYTFFFFDPKTLTLVRSHRITSSFENLNPYHKGLQGSEEMIHVPFSQKKVSALISSKKGLNKEAVLDWHGAQVDACTFSPKKQLVATGSANGRVFIHNMAGGSLLGAFGRAGQHVCALQFDNDGRYLAASFTDKTLIVYDLELGLPLSVENSSLSGIAEALFFLESGSLLFVVCRGGESLLIDLKNSRTLSREKRLEGWPSALCPGQDEAHLLVATRQSRLYFFRPRDNALIGELHLQKSGISLLKLLGDHLFIGYTDGTLEIVGIAKELTSFALAVDMKRYDEARRIMLRQPFLIIHPVMQKFEAAWERTLAQAANKIARKDIRGAQELAAPFLFDPRMAETFERMMNQKFIFGRFTDAVDRKDYASAYHIAEKTPEVRALSTYADLENLWNKSCAKARKMIETDVAKNRKHIVHLLKPFEEIAAKKPIVEGLTRQHKAYLEAKRALSENNYERFFDLSEEFTYLKSLDLYQRLYPLIERIFDQAAQLESKGDYCGAVNMLEPVRTLAPFKKRAHEDTLRFLQKQSFTQLVEQNRITDAYALAEKTPYLKETSEFAALHRKFQEVADMAVTLAYSGKTKDALDLFNPWLGIDHLKHKIVSTVRIGYLYEVRNALKNRVPICHKTTLKEYVLRFCKDPEITKICDEFRLSDTLEALHECGNPEGYLEHGLPDSILARVR